MVREKKRKNDATEECVICMPSSFGAMSGRGDMLCNLVSMHTCRDVVCSESLEWWLHSMASFWYHRGDNSMLLVKYVQIICMHQQLLFFKATNSILHNRKTVSGTSLLTNWYLMEDVRYILVMGTLNGRYTPRYTGWSNCRTNHDNKLAHRGQRTPIAWLRGLVREP